MKLQPEGDSSYKKYLPKYYEYLDIFLGRQCNLLAQQSAPLGEAPNVWALRPLTVSAEAGMKAGGV